LLLLLLCYSAICCSDVVAPVDSPHWLDGFGDLRWFSICWYLFYHLLLVSRCINVDCCWCGICWLTLFCYWILLLIWCYGVAVVVFVVYPLPLIAGIMITIPIIDGVVRCVHLCGWWPVVTLFVIGYWWRFCCCCYRTCYLMIVVIVIPCLRWLLIVVVIVDSCCWCWWLLLLLLLIVTLWFDLLLFIVTVGDVGDYDCDWWWYCVADYGRWWLLGGVVVVDAVVVIYYSVIVLCCYSVVDCCCWYLLYYCCDWRTGWLVGPLFGVTIATLYDMRFRWFAGMTLLDYTFDLFMVVWLPLLLLRLPRCSVAVTLPLLLRFDTVAVTLLVLLVVDCRALLFWYCCITFVVTVVVAHYRCYFPLRYWFVVTDGLIVVTLPTVVVVVDLLYRWFGDYIRLRLLPFTHCTLFVVTFGRLRCWVTLLRPVTVVPVVLRLICCCWYDLIGITFIVRWFPLVRWLLFVVIVGCCCSVGGCCCCCWLLPFCC